MISIHSGGTEGTDSHIKAGLIELREKRQEMVKFYTEKVCKKVMLAGPYSSDLKWSGYEYVHKHATVEGAQPLREFRGHENASEFLGVKMMLLRGQMTEFHMHGCLAFLSVHCTV